MLPFGSCLCAMQKITLADHADDPATVGQHRQAADMLLNHKICDVVDRGVRAHRSDIPFASATALASAMIPIVIAVLQAVSTPGINIVGMTMLLQFVVSFGFILVVNAPQNMWPTARKPSRRKSSSVPGWCLS